MNPQVRCKNEVAVRTNIVSGMADNFRVGCRNSSDGRTIIRITLLHVSRIEIGLEI
jgi:hypothetical protein